MLQDTPSKTPSDSAVSHETASEKPLRNETSTDDTAPVLDNPAVTDALVTETVVPDTVVAEAPITDSAVTDSVSIAPITAQPATHSDYAASIAPQAAAITTAEALPVIAAAPDTPTASSDERAAGLPASRKDRWWAAVIDMVLQVLASLPFVWYMGLETFKNPTPQLALANSANALLVYLVLHGYLLHKYGQTIGKAEYGMRIEMLNGDKASLQHIVLWRYLPIIVLSFVPLIGQFVAGCINPLLIFRKDRRCLHDHIAGTQVRYCYREQQADTTTAAQSGDTDAPDTPVAATAKPVPDQLQ